MTHTNDPRDERGAADFLGVSVRTLQGWRRLNKGPRYYKVSTLVRYRIKDLEDYLAKHVVEPCDIRVG